MPGTTDRPELVAAAAGADRGLAAHPGVQAVAQVLAHGLHPVELPAKKKPSKSRGNSKKGSDPPPRGAMLANMAPGRAQLWRNASRSALIDVGVGGRHAVREARVGLQRPVLQQLRPTAGRSRR